MDVSKFLKHNVSFQKHDQMIVLKEFLPSFVSLSESFRRAKTIYKSEDDNGTSC